MSLESRLFRGDSKLEAAAVSNSAHVVPGAIGEHVAKIQQALIALDQATIDGAEIASKRYGPSTANAVLSYKKKRDIVNRSYQTQADNIVGKMTIAALDQEMLRKDGPSPNIARRTGVNCGNSVLGGSISAIQRQEALRTEAFAQTDRASEIRRVSLTRLPAFPSLPSLPPLPSLPSLKRLTPGQESTARSVFGSSIDFSNVFISDKTGLGGLPFTVGIPATIVSSSKQIMNLGTFSPSRDVLIHELTHVWQSQHHKDPTAFMTNSVQGQAAAVAANQLLAQADPTVKSNSDFPVHFPFSTYAYIPGDPFGNYGAEQIANSVEHGESPIVSHVAGVAAGRIDSANETSLKTTRIGDRRRLGTKF